MISSYCSTYTVVTSGFSFSIAATGVSTTGGTYSCNFVGSNDILVAVAAISSGTAASESVNVLFSFDSFKGVAKTGASETDTVSTEEICMYGMTAVVLFGSINGVSTIPY